MQAAKSLLLSDWSIKTLCQTLEVIPLAAPAPTIKAQWQPKCFRREPHVWELQDEMYQWSIKIPRPHPLEWSPLFLPVATLWSCNGPAPSCSAPSSALGGWGTLGRWWGCRAWRRRRQRFQSSDALLMLEHGQQKQRNKNKIMAMKTLMIEYQPCFVMLFFVIWINVDLFMPKPWSTRKCMAASLYDTA